MATFETSRPAPFGAISAYRVVAAFDNLRCAVIAWNNARATQNALAKLSDHELNDIGLSRGDIARIGENRIR